METPHFQMNPVMTKMKTEEAITEHPGGQEKTLLHLSLQCQKLYPDAKVPCKTNDSDAGYDLSAHISDLDNFKKVQPPESNVWWERDEKNNVTIILPPGESVVIPLGLKMACPVGVVLMLKPRSGLAYKFRIDVLAGVVDSGYRGEVMAILINHGKRDFTFQHGDRIAQVVASNLYSPCINEFLECESLEDSDRMEKGFGSSGV